MTQHLCCAYPISPNACPVAVPAARLTAARTSTTAVKAGYVPDGLDPKEWEAMKKKKNAKTATNKKFYKEKKYEVGCLVPYTRRVL